MRHFREDLVIGIGDFATFGKPKSLKNDPNYDYPEHATYACQLHP